MSAYASSGISNSSEAPVISAAPSAMCRTFSTSSFIAASVAARTKNSACAKSGTTFGTSPPWVMIPWMRASAVMCWRKALIPLKTSMTAFSALMPLKGSDAACAARP